MNLRQLYSSSSVLPPTQFPNSWCYTELVQGDYSLNIIYSSSERKCSQARHSLSHLFYLELALLYNRFLEVLETSRSDSPDPGGSVCTFLNYFDCYDQVHICESHLIRDFRPFSEKESLAHGHLGAPEGQTVVHCGQSKSPSALLKLLAMSNVFSFRLPNQRRKNIRERRMAFTKLIRKN